MRLMGKNLQKCFMLIVLLIVYSNAQWIPMTSGIGKEIKCMTKLGSSLYVGTSDAGIYTSSISDTNWVEKKNGLSNLKVYSLASNGSTLAAGTYGGGVFLSTDNGDNWVVKNSGLTLPYVYTIGFSGSNIIAGTGGYGVFLSTNSGSNWSTVLPSSYTSNAFYDNDTVAYIGVGPSIYRSSDHGAVWNPVVTSNTTIKAFAVTPAQGGDINIFAGTLDGVFLSTDKGAKWTTINNGLSYTNVNGLARSGNTIFAATENGGVFMTNNDGTLWSDINTGLPASTSVRAIIVDENWIYIATSSGTVWKRNISEVTSFERRSENVPASFKLEQNYPNPFNPSTHITFSLHKSGFTTLKIFDVTGREVATLIEQQLSSGTYQVTFNAQSLSSGVYVYQLQTDNIRETKRMLLMK